MHIDDSIPVNQKYEATTTTCAAAAAAAAAAVLCSVRIVCTAAW
jgi:cobalamin biosynthesis protein CbiD